MGGPSRSSDKTPTLYNGPWTEEHRAQDPLGPHGRRRPRVHHPPPHQGPRRGLQARRLISPPSHHPRSHGATDTAIPPLHPRLRPLWLFRALRSCEMSLFIQLTVGSLPAPLCNSAPLRRSRPSAPLRRRPWAPRRSSSSRRSTRPSGARASRTSRTVSAFASPASATTTRTRPPTRSSTPRSRSSPPPTSRVSRPLSSTPRRRKRGPPSSGVLGAHPPHRLGGVLKSGVSQVPSPSCCRPAEGRSLAALECTWFSHPK